MTAIVLPSKQTRLQPDSLSGMVIAYLYLTKHFLLVLHTIGKGHPLIHAEFISHCFKHYDRLETPFYVLKTGLPIPYAVQGTQAYPHAGLQNPSAS